LKSKLNIKSYGFSPDGNGILFFKNPAGVQNSCRVFKKKDIVDSGTEVADYGMFCS